VVTESYFSMDADSPDLTILRRLCHQHRAALLVDEAHALGVLGPDGRGRCADAGVEADAVIGTFGKAFGAGGAFVAGCPALVAWLWNRARSFVFSTGLSPTVTAAALQGLRRAQSEPDRRRRVLAAATLLREGMVRLGVEPAGFGHILPWVLGDAGKALRVAASLRERGLDVRAIRPPSVPSGTARIRLTVTASHDSADIERALADIAAVLGTGAGA
jgi:8-amino-7-oxononanoate synthase